MNWDQVYLLMSVVEKAQQHPQWAPFATQALEALNEMLSPPVPVPAEEE